MRMGSLMLEAQRGHLPISWNMRKIVLIGFIPILASINLGVRVVIVPNKELLPFVMEVVLLLTVIFGLKTVKKRRSSEKYLEFLHEGLIILSKKGGKNRRNNSFKLVSCNLKALTLLTENFRCDQVKKTTFKDLDALFTDFHFSKAKTRVKEMTLINISMQEGLSKAPKTLSELLGWLERMSRNGETLHFQRKNIGGTKNYVHSLTLTIHSESSVSETLYFLTLRKIDSLLDLKAKNDLKTRLLSAFSHELKTPLNGSIPMLEALSASPKLDPDLRSPYLDNTVACLKLLDNSLSNILDYSLMASDQFLVNLGYFAVQELVFDALSIVRPQVKIKGLELYVEADAITIQRPLNSDYTRGKQILLNILSNAVQFTNKGEILLKVTICKDFDGVEFEVRDTGIGIPEPKLSLLKEKLALGLEEQQVNSTGSCLGLTISNQLALLLGVRGLEIESGPSGTSVRFMLKDQTKTGAVVGEAEVRIRNGEKSMTFLERSQEALQRMELRRRLNFSFYHGNSNKYIHAQSEDIEVATKPEDLDTSNGLRRKLELYNFGGLIGAKIEVGFKPDNNYNFYSKPTENEVNPFIHGEVKSPDFIQEAGKSPSSGFGSGTKLDVFIEHNTLKSGVDVLRRRASAQHIQKGPAFFLNHKSLPLKEFSKTGGVLSQTSIPMKEPYKMLTLLKEQSSHKDAGDAQELAAVIDSCSIVVSIPPQHECPQVLIVDDDAFNLFSLETLFRMFDYRCRKAMNGKEAVDFLVGQPKCAHCSGVRLIMMDYQMPVMDGIESTRNIMTLIQSGKIGEVPVIGCTAFTAKNEISRCFEAGMKDVVFKPVTRGTVAMVVENWLM